MNTGQIISGVGHTVLIGWALIGNLFAATPPPFEVTSVTSVSTEEFNAIMAAQRSPEASSDVVAPDAPEIDPDTPDLASQTDPATEQAQPETAETAPPDEAPDVTELTPPAETIVEDTPPELIQPTEDVAALLPETGERPQERPEDRIAPEAVEAPEPDTAIDEVVREEVVPDETAEIPQEETDATAPEAAATEIVTEAEQLAAAAVTQSLRPQTRPAAAAPEPSEDATVEAAIQAAISSTSDTSTSEAASRPTPSGPPLSFGEKDALRVAVSKCWNVDAGATSASVVVTISVQMNRQGQVVGVIDRLSASGGDASAQRAAYQRAERAVLRCQRGGYQLPPEKFAHWEFIEMTFNPEKMRIR